MMNLSKKIVRRTRGRDTSITLEGIAAGTAAYGVFMNKLSLVEKFNGQTFKPLPADSGATLSYTILGAQQAANDAVFDVRRMG